MYFNRNCAAVASKWFLLNPASIFFFFFFVIFVPCRCFPLPCTASLRAVRLLRNQLWTRTTRRAVKTKAWTQLFLSCTNNHGTFSTPLTFPFHRWGGSVLLQLRNVLLMIKPPWKWIVFAPTPAVLYGRTSVSVHFGITSHLHLFVRLSRRRRAPAMSATNGWWFCTAWANCETRRGTPSRKSPKTSWRCWTVKAQQKQVRLRVTSLWLMSDSRRFPSSADSFTRNPELWMMRFVSQPAVVEEFFFF